MNAVTIRGVDENIAKKLKIAAKKQGKSVNQLILGFIKLNLGLKKEKKFSRNYDDLDDLFGRWNNDEYDKINKSINSQRQIDQELWK